MRGALCALALVMLISAGSPPVRAADEGVPIALQIELLDRLLWYERRYQREAGKPIGVLVVVRPRDTQSARAAGQLSAALARLDALGGRPVRLSQVELESAAQVARVVRERGAYVVYLAPGLSDVLTDLTRSLAGSPSLTVSAVPTDVDKGVVLGFELSSSKPRIVINLRTARAQLLELSAQLLRIARVLP